MEITMRARSTLLVLSALFALPSAAISQQSPAPALDFSGIMFGHWLMRTDSLARSQTGGKRPTRFDLGRVYLNFRTAAGEKGSIRVTTDIFQNTGGGGYYAGWAVRMKYAYFQYDATRAAFGVDGLAMNARVGMIQNFVVEHVDSYWPRWLSQDALETHAFFSSADLGVGTTFTLPKRRGEVYATIVNGNGFGAAETDRFKDVAARFSWTPFANDSGFMRTFAISPWYSIGKTAGAFANGGPGQVGPGLNGAITEGVQRDRRGVFLGVRERRLTIGADWAQRLEGIETGLNTNAVPRVLRDRTSDLLSAFAFVRPLELADKRQRSRLSLFGRYDNFHLENPPAPTAAISDIQTKLAWAGVIWDLNSRASFTADFQQLKTTTITPTTNVTIPLKTFFLHWVVTY
jgi:hypothetical protein